MLNYKIALAELYAPEEQKFIAPGEAEYQRKLYRSTELLMLLFARITRHKTLFIRLTQNKNALLKVSGAFLLSKVKNNFIWRFSDASGRQKLIFSS